MKVATNATCRFTKLIKDFSKDYLGSRRGIRPRPVRCLHLISVFLMSKKLLFGMSVINCSDCDSSGLGSPNSSWSIARLMEKEEEAKQTGEGS